MASDDDFKIKGAATEEPQTSTAPPPEAKEEGELDPEPELAPPTHEPVAAAATTTEQDPQDGASQAAALEKYRWYKIFDQGYFYFMHCDTQDSMYTEPTEPYWVWDPVSAGPDLVAGLQMPSGEGASSRAPGTGSIAAPAAESATAPAEEYKGYNPKIHGSYDPNADYARWHDEQREKEQAAEQARLGLNSVEQPASYVVSGAFNARTGRFQTGEQSAERHNDYNKSSRQMEAFGNNIDAAANSHGGVSLKEQRRNQKISKKQLEALREKKKGKQKKKAMAFYTS